VGILDIIHLHGNRIFLYGWNSTNHPGNSMRLLRPLHRCRSFDRHSLVDSICRLSLSYYIALRILVTNFGNRSVILPNSHFRIVVDCCYLLTVFGHTPSRCMPYSVMFLLLRGTFQLQPAHQPIKNSLKSISLDTLTAINYRY